jgi:hypothetical protein
MLNATAKHAAFTAEQSRAFVHALFHDHQYIHRIIRANSGVARKAPTV